MQLNNKQNGHIIKITKFDINTNRIVYTEYQHILYDSNGNLVKEFIFKTNSIFLTEIDFKDTLANGTISIYDNIQHSYLTVLKTKIENSDDWEISDNKQNWIFTDRPFRIISLNKFVLQELQPVNIEGDLSDIGTILEREKTLNFGFYLNDSNDDITVLYANTVDDNDGITITPYLNKTMWLETKL